MNSVKIKAKNNWDFVLYQVGEEEIISVVFFNSMVDYSRSFKLTKQEKLYGFEELKKLSEEIRNNYDLFKEREVIPTVINEELDT